MAKFQIFYGRDRDYYWHLKANNGEIVCVAEGYESKQSAQKAIAFVKLNAAKSPVEDQTA